MRAGRVSVFLSAREAGKEKEKMDAIQEVINDVFDYECCDIKAPKKIEFGFSHFAGMYRATCKKCSYVNMYWECACELVHDCNEMVTK